MLPPPLPTTTNDVGWRRSMMLQRTALTALHHACPSYVSGPEWARVFERRIACVYAEPGSH